MKRKEAVALVILLASLGACVSVKRQDRQVVSFVFEFHDRGKIEAFDISLEARTDNLCIRFEDWPAESGALLSTRIAMSSHSELRFARNVGATECVLGCAPHVLKKGEVLRGRVNYSNFGPVDEVRALDQKRVEFLAAVRQCSAIDFPTELNADVILTPENVKKEQH